MHVISSHLSPASTRSASMPTARPARASARWIGLEDVYFLNLTKPAAPQPVR